MPSGKWIVISRRHNEAERSLTEERFERPVRRSFHIDVFAGLAGRDGWASADDAFVMVGAVLC